MASTNIFISPIVFFLSKVAVWLEDPRSTCSPLFAYYSNYVFFLLLFLSSRNEINAIFVVVIYCFHLFISCIEILFQQKYLDFVKSLAYLTYMRLSCLYNMSVWSPQYMVNVILKLLNQCKKSSQEKQVLYSM